MINEKTARGQIPPPPRGPLSPRQEPSQMRPYPGIDRNAPPPGPRRSPPREHHSVMGPYSGPSLSQPPPPPPPQSQGPPSQQQRVANPNYAGPGPQLPPAPNGMNGSAPQSLPPFGRGNSPRPEVRPLMDNRISSPKSGYPLQQYPHHGDISNPGGIEAGAPPPASALAAAEAAAAQRNDGRPGSVGPKRIREWEDESSMKKPASDEIRARMEDVRHRRPSTPSGEPFRRSASEARRIGIEDQRRIDDQRRSEEQRRAEDQRRTDEQRRAEDQRQANENYHPSEAAHHPPIHVIPNALPPMQGGLLGAHTPSHELPPPLPPQVHPVEERERERERLDHPPPPHTPIGEPERAARKMDVDEDYDDDGDDDKKGGIVSAAGSGPASAAGDAKTSSPTAVNGHVNNFGPIGQPKVETSV